MLKSIMVPAAWHPREARRAYRPDGRAGDIPLTFTNIDLGGTGPTLPPAFRMPALVTTPLYIPVQARAPAPTSTRPRHKLKVNEGWGGVGGSGDIKKDSTT